VDAVADTVQRAREAFACRDWPAVYKAFVQSRRARGRLDPDDLKQEALLATPPQALFTTSHYDGYPGLLIRLADVDDLLADLLEGSYRLRAPKRLVRQLDRAAVCS
jgi:hypothetical protein